MNRCRNATPFWTLAATLAVGSAFARTPIPIEPLTQACVSDLHFSPSGRSLLAMGGTTWVHGRSPHFILHAQEEHELYRAAEQAEFVWIELDQWFAPPPSEQGVHLFLISDAALWQQLAVRNGWPDSVLAVHARGELFVLRTRRDLSAQLAIPHELVHLRVFQLYGEGSPFWAEEGLAEVLGWRLADTFHRSRYRRELIRNSPPVPADRILSWQALSEFDGYAEEPILLDKQIRQIRNMTKTLLDSGGAERIKDFIAAFLEQRMPWPDGAIRGLELTEEALQALEEESRRRLLEEKQEGWPPEAQADEAPTPPLRPRSISGR